MQIAHTQHVCLCVCVGVVLRTNALEMCQVGQEVKIIIVY